MWAKVDAFGLCINHTSMLYIPRYVFPQIFYCTCIVGKTEVSLKMVQLMYGKPQNMCYVHDKTSIRYSARFKHIKKGSQSLIQRGWQTSLYETYQINLDALYEEYSLIKGKFT